MTWFRSAPSMNRFMELALCRALPHFTLSRRFYTASANSGHLNRGLNFLHSGHWNELGGAEGIASQPHRDLALKLQLPLYRLKPRLFAQGVQKWIGLEAHQARITQAQRRLEPFERLRPIAPLRVDRGVLVRRGITLCALYF